MNSVKTRSVFILFSILWVHLAFAQPVARKFYEMSHQEIDSIIRETSKLGWTVSERMNALSAYFLATPYNLTCVGDGPYALLEPWPLVNFKETNCMAFCEHVLALAISDNWDNFFNNLQQIRYHDGIIGMKTRNHYTMADWFPENRWILEDVTKEVGAEFTQSVTRTISHKRFFAGKGIEDTTYVLPDRELTVPYVPSEVLDQIKDRTRTGDISVLIQADKEDIFSAHMLLIAESNGQKVIRESSNRKMSTFDTDYDEWVLQIQNMPQKKYLGLAFLRVRAEINQPNQVILPWNIDSLKIRVNNGNENK